MGASATLVQRESNTPAAQAPHLSASCARASASVCSRHAQQPDRSRRNSHAQGQSRSRRSTSSGRGPQGWAARSAKGGLTSLRRPKCRNRLHARCLQARAHQRLLRLPQLGLQQRATRAVSSLPGKLTRRLHDNAGTAAASARSPPRTRHPRMFVGIHHFGAFLALGQHFLRLRQQVCLDAQYSRARFHRRRAVPCPEPAAKGEQPAVKS